jgi:hypothetical protein
MGQIGRATRLAMLAVAGQIEAVCVSAAIFLTFLPIKTNAKQFRCGRIGLFVHWIPLMHC